MSTTLAPVIKFRWFDGDGAPLAGGKVFTYAAGTSTPLATYSDYDGLVANTNPVILDAEGYADIRLGSDLYKFVISSSDDVVLITEDYVGNQTSSGSSTNGGFGAPEDIASASIVDLSTVESHFANITGTTTITGFGSNASVDAPIYLVKFQSALTLQNSSSLITRMSADMTTATGDHAYLEYLGSGIWIIYAYFRRDGSFDATTINCATLNVTTTANLP